MWDLMNICEQRMHLNFKCIVSTRREDTPNKVLSEPAKIDTSEGALFPASVNGEPLKRLRSTKSKREKNKGIGQHARLIYLGFARSWHYSSSYGDDYAVS